MGDFGGHRLLEDKELNPTANEADREEDEESDEDRRMLANKGQNKAKAAVNILFDMLDFSMRGERELEYTDLLLLTDFNRNVDSGHADQFFSIFDSNGDGVVNPKEFTTVLSELLKSMQN